MRGFCTHSAVRFVSFSFQFPLVASASNVSRLTYEQRRFSLAVLCAQPDYCAPEIIACSREGYNGAKVDAWSCGIILFALLSGHLPFREQDTEKLYDLILACQVQYPSWISPSAHDLLANLLVRDPDQRYDLQKVKRHPWFLEDYEGDDARLLKKRPFFNKNQKDLTGSTPTSPVVTPAVVPSYTAAPVVDSITTATHRVNGLDISPEETSAILPEGLARAQALARVREDHSPRPGSPAYEVDANVRAPTPPNSVVFTPVEDRPATPARHPTSASTSAAIKVAAAATAVPTLGNTSSLTSPSGGSVRRGSPSPVAALEHYEGHPQGQNQNRPTSENYFQDQYDSMQAENGGVGNLDDMSSDGSIEDYQNKPAPQLELPMEPLSRMRSAQETRRAQQSLQQIPAQRHSSDVGVVGVGSTLLARGTGGGGGGVGEAGHMPVNPQRRVFAPPAHANGTHETRGVRSMRPSEVIPSSPPVVYSPSSPLVAPFDRFGPSSPGYAAAAQQNPNYGSEFGNNVVGNGNGTQRLTHQIPWHNTAAGGGGGQFDDVNSSGLANGGSMQAELCANHIWNMMWKWRGATEAANAQNSMDLRSDLQQMYTELNAFSRAEDKLAIFERFFSLFEAHGLSEASGGVAANGHGGRSRVTSDFEEDSDDRSYGGSREDLGSGNGDPRFGASRHAGTDSEEEPLSWSPILADGQRHQSELHRRRVLSDLLTRWIQKASVAAAAGDASCGEVGDDEPPSSMDIRELQRLMQEQHSGREESNLAEDLVHLFEPGNSMGSLSGLHDAAVIPFGVSSLNQPGQSPPAPNVQSTRSVDSFTQHSRWQGNSLNAIGPNRGNAGRTYGTTGVDGNSVLPSEYVPGRFNDKSTLLVSGSGGPGHNNAYASEILGPFTGRNGLGNGDVPSFGQLYQSGAHQGGAHHGSHREKSNNMAASMGMHDVEYYGPDRKNGMATRLKGVLQTIKAKNQRLGENLSQFRSDLPPDIIMQILGRVLQVMGAIVTIKKETKRKMKCRFPQQQNWTLHAGIELVTGEDGLTTVLFRRSRGDRGRTDTNAFHAFFEQVKHNFAAEATARYPNPRGGGRIQQRRSRPRSQKAAPRQKSTVDGSAVAVA